MLNLRLSPQAIIDLENIYEYILTSWDIRIADNYQDNLYEAMLHIKQNPEIGSIYYFKKGDYRKLVINRHLIFYRTTNEECIIVRILHQRVDLGKQFS